MKHILGITGSLRTHSYNTALLKATLACLPDSVTSRVADISDIPLYNGERESEFPHAVERFKSDIESANALIIATPEYNRSVPGVLKNAIDWATRPNGSNSFKGKPVLVMGVSSGSWGTTMAQQHIKNILLYLECDIVGQPELYVARGEEKFNENGVLTDSVTQERVTKAISRLLERI